MSKQTLGLALLAALISVAASDQHFDAATYEQCLAQARKDPGQGFEAAESWRDHGGGVPAKHCVALALMGLKQYRDAALRLDALAGEMVREAPSLRAEVLAQAGEAWMEAGQPDNARAALTQAIILMPGHPDYFVSRAVAAAGRQDYKSALDDLNRAIALGGPQAEALAYRAAADRFLGDLAQARLDADHAIAIDPDLPEAYLERANIKRLTDDAKGARQDWLKVIALAPDSAAADAARNNIERLDVHVEPAPIAKH